MGASADDIIVSDCHEKGLLEIKCPHKYRSGLVEGLLDVKDFPLDESGHIKKDRMHYAQVQGQILILDIFSQFFIWIPLVNTNVANTLLVCVQCDRLYIRND